jgi:uncharacterized protein (TIGR02646 family)
MIKLTRERTPASVHKNFTGRGRLAKMLLLVEGQRKKNLKFNSSIWKTAKNQLKKESGGKCAYCEASTETVAHGDVEHFRPKSKYWWLAYCYDNYLYACQICNQTYKGDKFPIHGTELSPDPPFPARFSTKITKAQLRDIGKMFAPDPLDDAAGYPMAKFIKAVSKEKPGLIDPYMVDPEPFFKWVADPDLREVTIKPRSTKLAARRAYAAVEEFYGLNREELKRWRWRTYETAETFKDTLRATGLPAATKNKVRNQLKEMMSEQGQFAGMVRYFIKDVWKLRL